MFNLGLLTNYEFDSVMHIHEHSCTPYMRNEALTLSRLHAAHSRCFQHVWNSAYVRRTPARRTCIIV